MEILNADAIKKHPKLFTRVSNLNEAILQRSANGKNVSSGIYNFSINTNLCKMITVDGLTTYTFEVIREQDNGFFENLVVKELANGMFETKIYRYNVTLQEKHNILNGIDVDMTNKISTLPIDDTSFVTDIFSKIYFSKFCYEASSVFVPGKACKNGHLHPLLCDLEGSEAPQLGSYQTVYNTIPCPDTGGGGGGPTDPTDTGAYDGSETTSPTGGGGGGGGFGGTVVTTPCQELKKMTENDANKNSLEFLKTKTQGTKEFGFAVKKTPTGTYASPEVIPQDPKDSNYLDIKAFLTGEYIIFMHNHPKPSVGPPMFSGADVTVGLAELEKQGGIYNTSNLLPHNYSEYTITVAGYDAVSDKSITFALKIKDIALFHAAFDNEVKKEDFIDLVQETYEDLTEEGVRDPLDFGSDPRPATLHDFKDAFLKIITKKNMGIGLYQAIPGVDNKVKWSEVVYNSSQNKSSLLPCVN